MASARRGSWYDDIGGGQSSPSFVGIDMPSSVQGSPAQQHWPQPGYGNPPSRAVAMGGSGGVAAAPLGQQYQQQQQHYSSASNQQQQLRKQPSTTQMYSASSTPSLGVQQPNHGAGASAMMSPHTGLPNVHPSSPGAARPSTSSSYDGVRMSYSPTAPVGNSGYHHQQPSSSSNGQGTANLGLGMPRGILPQSISHQPTHAASPSGSSSSTSPYPDQQQQSYTSSHNSAQAQSQQRQRPSTLLSTQSYQQHPNQAFNRTNSSGSALSLSTSPTTAGQASPMTPTSPAYATSQQQQMNTGGGSTFRVPNPPNHQATPQQQQQQNRPHTGGYPQTGPHDGALQYAGYLDDPMNGIDRRPGSYSPSRYAIDAANASFAASQTPNSPYHQPQQSPRHTSSYFAPHNPTSAPPQQQQHTGSRQSALSPTYSRQPSSLGSPVASTSGAHFKARSESVSSQGPPLQPQYSPVQVQMPRHRARSTGSAFRRVKDASDLRPISNGQSKERRADPEGGTVSPLKALTTQLSQTYHLINPNFRYEFSLNPRRVLTKPSKPAGNDGVDNEDSDYILYVNDVLGGEGNKYLILDVLGQGTFGQVVKCQNMKTLEIVGVKVIKNKTAYYNQSTMEIIILEMLNNTYDPEDKHHILRLKDTFVHYKHLCLVFELLSSNLYELIKQNAFRGLSTSLVRVFTEQLLDALCVLKDARLIHCDLKPENILLKTLQSPDIKVIDFGSACHEKQTVYTYIQSRFYRSPEVLLGLPYSTSIDMWSLGCICVELFLGLPLFPGTSEYNQITRIVEMLGLPPKYMLESGKQVDKFFIVYFDEYGRKHWRLKSIDEYERDDPSVKEQPSKKFFAANTLPEIIKTYPNQRKGLKQADVDREMANRVSFIDFVTGLLNMNPMERWTPQQAKLHPFVLNEPLKQPFVPQMGHSRLSSSAGPGNMQGVSQHVTAQQAERPYGGLQPTPARASTKTYQDAAQYQQHLNQQQAHAAAMTASAYRQAQYPTNPYAQQGSDMSPNQMSSMQQQQQHQQHQQQHQQQQVAYSVPRLPPVSTMAPPSSRMSGMPQHSPSHSVSYSSNPLRNSSSGPLSPNVPTNPPAAHYQPIRGRSGTFSQMDVPPALQKLGLDLGSFKAIGTPQLRRDEQRAAWERRHAGDVQLDRRRSLKQANPHLEHLEYYAQGQPSGYYYTSPPSMQQPFSVVIDPRMAAEQQGAPSVTMPPPTYAGSAGSARYAQPSQQAMAGGGFDAYDVTDGLSGMLHQPLVPTQQGQRQSAYYAPGMQAGPSAGGYGASGQALPYPGQMTANGASGKQKRSDQQMWP